MILLASLGPQDITKYAPTGSVLFVQTSFQVPDNASYQAVKFEPQIGNKEAVHHILVFGCDFKMESDVSFIPMGTWTTVT